MAGLLFPKPRPAALERRDRRRDRVSKDEAESRKVRARSKGRCEIVVLGEGQCERRANQIHHMLGGWGRRARGTSILAERKQNTCGVCHPLITGHVLQRIGGPVPLWSDRYRRVT